jgi:hypothetical protein
VSYAHSWTINLPITPRIWWLIMSDTMKLVEAFPGPGGLSMGAENPDKRPYVSREEIHFNGGPSAQYEDFLLYRARISSRGNHGFCKTMRLPYERLVCAVLAAAADRTSLVQVSSDGNHNDWSPYVSWANTVLRRQIGIPIEAEQPTG